MRVVVLLHSCAKSVHRYTNHTHAQVSSIATNHAPRARSISGIFPSAFFFHNHCSWRELERRFGDPMGRWSRQNFSRRRTPIVVAWQALWLGISIEKQVSLWKGRHGHQAYFREFCRQCHHLLRKVTTQVLTKQCISMFDVSLSIPACSCRRKDRRWSQITMRSTSNSSGTWAGTRTPCTPTCSPMERATGRCSSSCGSIQPKTSTLIPSYGIHKTSCKLTFVILCSVTSLSHNIAMLTSFFIDEIPIRDFKNYEMMGVAFPTSQPMRLYSTLWNGEEWATRGGKVKTDWSEAPFTAYYRNFRANACVWSPDSDASSCSSKILMPSVASENAWLSQELDDEGYRKMISVQKKYRVYNYCADLMRFLGGIPRECTLWQQNHFKDSYFHKHAYIFMKMLMNILCYICSLFSPSDLPTISTQTVRTALCCFGHNLLIDESNRHY